MVASSTNLVVPSYLGMFLLLPVLVVSFFFAHNRIRTEDLIFYCQFIACIYKNDYFTTVPYTLARLSDYVVRLYIC